MKVNAAEWNSLSADDQSKISDILKNAVLLKHEGSLTPDANAPAIGLAGLERVTNLSATIERKATQVAA